MMRAPKTLERYRVQAGTDFLTRTDAAIRARGTSRAAVSVKAGHSKGLIQNWDRFKQDAGVGKLAEVAEALNVAPAWLAYGSTPQPVAAPNDCTAHKAEIDPDTFLGVAYAAWKADDGQLEERFFDALEMTGLLDATYILRQDGSSLVYDYIGFELSKTLGFSWWITAPGKVVGQDDPDPVFSGWCLQAYQESMEREEPVRDDCLVVSRYTGVTKGWAYRRLLLPFAGGLIVLNEVVR